MHRAHACPYLAPHPRHESPICTKLHRPFRPTEVRTSVVRYGRCNFVQFVGSLHGATSFPCVCVCFQSLSLLVFFLAMNKGQQESEWEKSPLDPAQLVYAATDAFAHLQVHQVMRARASALAEMTAGGANLSGDHVEAPVEAEDAIAEVEVEIVPDLSKFDGAEAMLVRTGYKTIAHLAMLGSEFNYTHEFPSFLSKGLRGKLKNVVDAVGLQSTSTTHSDRSVVLSVTGPSKMTTDEIEAAMGAQAELDGFTVKEYESLYVAGEGLYNAVSLLAYHRVRQPVRLSVSGHVTCMHVCCACLCVRSSMTFGTSWRIFSTSQQASRARTTSTLCPLRRTLCTSTCRAAATR